MSSVFAWPSAQMGVMGAQQAVNIVNRREIADADDPEAARDKFADTYKEEHLNAHAVTADGFVDEVIPPSETRERIASALEALSAANRPAPSGGNIPL